MKFSLLQASIALSRLVPSRTNPRRVKPGREAHERLVALIRAHGLLHPLIVRPDKDKKFVVIAGNRRLAALKEIHRGDGDPKISCMLRDVDPATAEALSLGENFGREAMHPLDEAQSFAKLASAEGKGAEAIAAEFGVTEHYVRQRMKLAKLAEPVKSAYREGTIDTGTAAAFAAVPEDQQVKVWQEVGGKPRHPDHVRNVIAHQWIDAKDALFDPATLPESAVSQDLFGERVLVEREAFMQAQAQVLVAEQKALQEAGSAEVVVGQRENVQDRLFAMDTPPREFDEATTRKLAKIGGRLQKLEETVRKLGEGDEARLNRLQERYELLEVEAREIEKAAPLHFSEETKAIGTVLLILDPDGRVHREYRVPRRKSRPSAAGNSYGQDRPDTPPQREKPPTPDELSDRQLAVTFTHQAVAVRHALLANPAARKRVLALILHEKVRSEALAIRHDPNGTTAHIAGTDGFPSPAWDEIRTRRAKLDPFLKEHFVEDGGGYERLAELPGQKIDALIDLLTVECLTAHMVRPTELVQRLATELKVNVRACWKPDALWLSGFQKIQLAHLIAELLGPVHAPAPEKKKSELVEVLAKIFADAADGKLEDKELANRVNEWLPANLRHVKEDEAKRRTPLATKSN